MYRVNAIICAIVILAIGTISAATGMITGTITDKSTGDVIPFASIQIEGTGRGAVADTTGTFEMTRIASGTYHFIVSAVGYKAEHIEVTIQSAGRHEVTAELAPSHVDAGAVVVTGTKTPRYVKEVPVFTEVISKSVIDDKGAATIFEALEGESGINVEQQCQGCNFSILRMQGLGGDHTQVLIDGQPIYSGLAAVYGLQQMSTAEVAQIEIVKGAGSALYGSSAVAGAINIVSAIPQKTEGKVGIEFGEHGTNRYDFTASARRDNMGIFLFAQQSEQDELDETGDVNAEGGVDNPDGWLDRVRASNKNAGFNFFLDDVFAVDRLAIRGRLMSESRAGGWAIDNLFENPFAPATEKIDTDRYSGQMEYHIWLADGSELQTSLALSGQKRDATNDTFLSDYEEAYGETPPVDLLRPYVAEEQFIIGNLNWNKPIGSRHRLLLGAQVSYNKLDESGMYLDIDTQEPYTSNSTKQAYEIGAFIQDELKLAGKLEAVAGLRFDYHTSEDEFRGSGDVLPQGLEPLEYEESALNPRFSLKYKATDEFVLRSSIGSGFRVPYGFSEDLHLCSGSPRVYKGGTLKPEKSFSYSITADYTAETFTATLNLYRTELKDAIAFVEADQNVADLGYTYEWRNIDNAYVMGAEFSGSIEIAEGFGLGGRLEVFEGKYANPRADWVGTPYEEISRNITRFPQVSGGLKSEYSLGTWKLVAGADYKGKQYIDLTEPADPADVKIHETESFVLFNAKISKTIFERYLLYVGAKNLTGYTQEVKHIDDAAFMYAPVYGRIVYAGIQISL